MHDKVKIPVREPGTPESATGHQCQALSRSNIDLKSSNHNYHSVNLAPYNTELPNT